MTNVNVKLGKGVRAEQLKLGEWFSFKSDGRYPKIRTHMINEDKSKATYVNLDGGYISKIEFWEIIFPIEAVDISLIMKVE